MCVGGAAVAGSQSDPGPPTQMWLCHQPQHLPDFTCRNESWDLHPGVQRMQIPKTKPGVGRNPTSFPQRCPGWDCGEGSELDGRLIGKDSVRKRVVMVVGLSRECWAPKATCVGHQLPCPGCETQCGRWAPGTRRHQPSQHPTLPGARVAGNEPQIAKAWEEKLVATHSTSV